MNINFMLLLKIIFNLFLQSLLILTLTLARFLEFDRLKIARMGIVRG